MEKIPYLRSLNVEVDNAATFFILDSRIPSGSTLFVQHISFEDRTNGVDAIRIGRGKDEFEPHWWEEQLTIVAATVRWMDKEQHIVPEGERVILRLDGSTLADHIFVEIEGYLTRKITGAKSFLSRKRTEIKGG